MILFIILALILSAILVGALLFIGFVGGALLLVLGDLFVFVLIIAGIITLIIKTR